MSLYAISDLHLPLGKNKPMDIFKSWENYVQRIEENWKKTVRENDTVLLCGDLSWATYLEDTVADFDFLSKLPGKKIISKGNHDYWWTTMSKLNKFLEEKEIKDVVFLNNNAYLYEDVAICAARGWKSPFDKDFSKEDEKIYEREIIRLRLSLEEGLKLSNRLIAMLHYPPEVGMNEVLEEYKVEKCIFGHLHTKPSWDTRPVNSRDILVSADFLQFNPLKIME